MGPNAIILLQLLTQAATSAAQYAATVNQATAAGRDVSDAEVAAARAQAKAAVDALDAL